VRQAQLLHFRSGEELGWRAGEPGVQVIRLVFHQPQRVLSNSASV
jgi:hypothetical protein